MGRFILSKREKKILQKLGETIFPETSLMPRFKAKDVEERLEIFFNDAEEMPEMPIFCRAMLNLVEEGSRLRYLRPLSKLQEKKRLDYLNRFWLKATLPKRLTFRLLTIVLKASYLDDPVIFDGIGLEYRKPVVKKGKQPRWRKQILHGRHMEHNHTMEAEVVVVGTGAGGATVAHELARKGNAVVMVEEGDYFDRTRFSGRPFEMQSMMYMRSGMTTALGNVPIPVPLGRTVGGSTTINSGTCFRTPRRVLRGWREDLGLREYTPANMEPYFQRVETILEVQPADMKVVGKNGEIIARGADRLGYRHGPLLRNAPDCDGQSCCAMGCPSGAKRSTDVSFVPKALQSNANLLCRVRAEEILIKGGRAAGVRARSLDTGKQVTVRAPVVVLSAGAFGTPLMLMKQKLCNSSGQLGRNLSLHPAVAALAMMDEEVNPEKSIPQGYMVDEFQEEGLLFEGVAFPLDALSLIIGFIGRKSQEIIQNYKRLASFGVMVCDTSRGRVVPGLSGEPFAFYRMNRQDFSQILRGIGILVKIYLAADAREVFVNVHRWKPMRTLADLEDNLRLKNRPSDVDMSAFHPLGSCHMSGFRGRSVCDPNGETYDVRNLFIADGSLIPPSLGVNPQITISAVAARVGDYIHDRISRI